MYKKDHSNEPRVYKREFKQVSVFTSEQKLKELQDLGYDKLLKRFEETCVKYGDFECDSDQWLWMPEMIYILESLHKFDTVRYELHGDLGFYWRDAKRRRQEKIEKTNHKTKFYLTGFKQISNGSMAGIYSEEKTKVYLTEFKRFSDYTSERKYRELEDMGFEKLYDLFVDTCKSYGKTIILGPNKAWTHEMYHVLTSMFYEDQNMYYLDIQELQRLLKGVDDKHNDE